MLFILWKKMLYHKVYIKHILLYDIQKKIEMHKKDAWTWPEERSGATSTQSSDVWIKLQSQDEAD